MSPTLKGQLTGSNGVNDDGIKSVSTEGEHSNGADKPAVSSDRLNEFGYPQNGSGRNYVLPNTWHSKKTKIRVACIGGGASGTFGLPCSHDTTRCSLACRDMSRVQDATSDGSQHLGAGYLREE